MSPNRKKRVLAWRQRNPDEYQAIVDGRARRKASQDRLEKFASVNRRVPTLAERELLRRLDRRATGVYWVFEQPLMRRYIADFYSPQVRLVIEVDGGYHSTAHQITRDITRDGDMWLRGIQVLRFSNARVMSDVDGVVREIAAAVALRKKNKSWKNHRRWRPEVDQLAMR